MFVYKFWTLGTLELFRSGQTIMMQISLSHPNLLSSHLGPRYSNSLTTACCLPSHMPFFIGVTHIYIIILEISNYVSKLFFFFNNCIIFFIGCFFSMPGILILFVACFKVWTMFDNIKCIIDENDL